MSVQFDLRDTLSAHPYFADLPPVQVRQLAAEAYSSVYEAGEIIFLEGERSAGLHVVETGSVKIYKLSIEGREHILHICGAGESFNDISALDGGPNPANTAALSEVTLWIVPTAALQAALAEYHELVLAVLNGLTSRVRNLVQLMEDLTLYAVPARLARFLLAQAEDPSLDGPGVTRAAIAAHLATTPETISRALRALSEAGAIRFDRHRIVIIDADLLRDLAMIE